MKRITTLMITLLAGVVAVTAAEKAKNPASKSTTASGSAIPAAIRPAMASFDAGRLAAHDKFLASDLLEGRGPGTRGDAIAMEYIAAQFQAAGLKPDGDNGTYYQNIDLLGIRLQGGKSSVSFVHDGQTTGPLTYLDQFVATDQSQNETSALDADILFVGHGVVAPEHKWDDYKGVDTRGKILVMLVDDPPANANEPDLFKGKARTYYGRWTYKYDTGAAKEAAGVLLIHTGQAAGYPWEVVRNSWGGESSFVRLQPGQPSLHLAGWITEAVAQQLFKTAGLDLNQLTQAAASRDFKPVSLNTKLTGNLSSTIRPFQTANVVGKLEGSDPRLREQAVLYSAHHDHLGIGKEKNGDTIYNGAIDNASGCAVLIELARVWAETKPRPKRSILFAAVAAEEQGLLGSAYYGQHPTVPAGRIAVNLNFDSVFEMGRIKNVTMTGVERTSFFPTAQRVTKALGLRIDPDAEPEQGHYYRSDHFSLGKVGIPAFSIDPGSEVAGKPAGYGKKLLDAYHENDYHQPSDQFNPDWDWSEGVQMAQLGYWLGWEAAQAREMPNWNQGDEFRGARDRSLKQ
jgi:Zn-dependent M28 family amino/carboxypeptidase